MAEAPEAIWGGNAPVIASREVKSRWRQMPAGISLRHS